ncbi:MAG: penicillin acylase family protein, partial [bacterium]|nr:penicillin acylase family protein [bacterium]
MRRPAVVVLFVMTTAVVLCLLLVAHIRFYSSRSRLPESGNKVEKVLGVESVIEIRFDSAGIPHISALGESDLWFAVGYVHARERFFQMDLCRRLATGRLAEVFGESLLPSDRAMRTLRLGATAQAQSGMLSRSEIEVFEAYAAGVNAALDVWGRWIAPEVWLLGVDPVPWTVSDTLSIGVLFELGMTSAGREEVRRAHELTALGKDRALDLWGWSPEEARRWLPPQPDSLASVLSETALPGWPSSSNVWAIGPSRSVEGATLLGTSLSLPASMPTTGFALHLSSPGINVAGVGLPGTPAILVGHTEEVAWGISPVRLDDQDLFYLKVDDSRGRELIDGSWQPVRTVTEKITVREQKEPEIVKVSIAQSGPIIADDGRTVLALAWTGYHGPSSLTAFLQMNHANSVSGVATAWHDVIGPALHIVAADSDGQILHQVAGKVPIRRRGAGRLPAPGEYSQWAWQG